MNFNPNKMTPADVKKARVLRVNASSQAYYVASAPKPSKPAKSSIRRAMGYVESPSFSRLMDPGVYTTGMGEVGTVDRPGSLAAYTLPSRGIGV